MKSTWLLLLLFSAAALATEDHPGSLRPLLMPGKETLYQRILTAPDATLAQTPGATEKGAPVIPFSALYVYAREQGAREQWLQVGTDRFGQVIGWLPESKTLEWHQGLTVEFRDPTGHDTPVTGHPGSAPAGL